MKELKDAYKNNTLHHAYLFSRTSRTKDDLIDFIETQLGVHTHGNPDVHFYECDTLGIDDSRTLQSFESHRAVEAGKKLFIISCQSITREAQNALLKTFEEPTEGTHFFVMVNHPTELLPTLQSRMQLIEGDDAAIDISFAKTFVSANPAERLALIKDICDTKDKHQANELLNSIEVFAHQQTDFKNASSETVQLFTEIQDIRSYLNDRGSSVKMLLEHLALITPRYVPS